MIGHIAAVAFILGLFVALYAAYRVDEERQRDARQERVDARIALSSTRGDRADAAPISRQVRS